MDGQPSITSPVDAEVDWYMTDACNFDCAYCYPAVKARRRRPRLPEVSPQAVVNGFAQIGKTLIHMTGGEPLLFPRFTSMCERLSTDHFLGVSTNLSTPEADRFAARIDPTRVAYIWAAVHLGERLKREGSMQRFEERFLLLKRRGFPIRAVYVLTPWRLARYRTDIDSLSATGVTPVLLKVFKGMHRGRSYPESFPRSAWEQIESHSGLYSHNVAYLRGQRDFRGRPCRAGFKFFKVDVDGAVQRCASDGTRYGNLFTGSLEKDTHPRPCRVRKVLALSQCHRFVEPQDPSQCSGLPKHTSDEKGNGNVGRA